MSNMMLIKELAKSGKTYARGVGLQYIKPELEFYKWLNYEPEFEKERKSHLNSLQPLNLSMEQLDELRRYKLFELYGNIFRECVLSYSLSEEYVICASQFMQNNDIISIIKYKLTNEEQSRAIAQAVSIFESMNEEECSNYLQSNNTNTYREKYLNMDMVEAYIFRLVVNKAIRRANNNIGNARRKNM